MSLAAVTREAADGRPFLLAALRAGVVNYTAAARYLESRTDLTGDTEAIATALRRYAEELPDEDAESRSVRVAMESGLGPLDGDADRTEAPLLAVGDEAFEPGAGSLTGVVAMGEVDAAALSHALSRLDAAGVAVVAAAVGGDALVVVVERRDGADAVRVVEDALSAVPATG
jgi:hypothetical protein